MLEDHHQVCLESKLHQLVRVRQACHDPDFDLAKGSSSDGFESFVFAQIIPKNHKRNTFIYTEYPKDEKSKG